MSDAGSGSSGEEIWRPKINQQAVGRLYAFVQAQAAVLSYVDVYWLLSAVSVTMFLSSILLKRNEPGRGGNVSVH